MRGRRTIEEIGGFVTVHVALPPPILKWVVTVARREGHKDISQVIRRSLEALQRQPLPRLKSAPMGSSPHALS
jgi:hypothetical protein